MTIEYGDISPRTGGYVTKRLLEQASTGFHSGTFGDFAPEPEGPDDDSLYICGACCDGRKATAGDPLAQRPCPYRKPHNKLPNRGCGQYDPRNIEEQYVIRMVIDQDHDLDKLKRSMWEGQSEEEEGP